MVVGSDGRRFGGSEIVKFRPQCFSLTEARNYNGLEYSVRETSRYNFVYHTLACNETAFLLLPHVSRDRIQIYSGQIPL